MGQAGVVAPVLTYLFHRLEERFDGRPTLLVLDEAWVFLDHPLFAARIREWLKVLRKKNVAVVFATQSLADIADSSDRAGDHRELPAAHLPAQRPRDRAAVAAPPMSGSGSTTGRSSWSAARRPSAQYYLQSARGNRLFELGLGPVALALCGASDPGDPGADRRGPRRAWRRRFRRALPRAMPASTGPPTCSPTFHAPQPPKENDDEDSSLANWPASALALAPSARSAPA